ncbi:uncharacterized protein LOC113330180 isoform X1 [Papaver somniferum]|uniref:uncharacterized protein LOC113330180 isoform X1 n=1 Tax=Papaver somniferum TaxID=3469 RepID=UPI000E704F0F|nr:uncharacterized protein LOC113330180 isoform X1 [Papaver somniferum]
MDSVILWRGTVFQDHEFVLERVQSLEVGNFPIRIMISNNLLVFVARSSRIDIFPRIFSPDFQFNGPVMELSVLPRDFRLTSDFRTFLLVELPGHTYQLFLTKQDGEMKIVPLQSAMQSPNQQCEPELLPSSCIHSDDTSLFADWLRRTNFEKHYNPQAVRVSTQHENFEVSFMNVILCRYHWLEECSDW